MIQIKKDMLQIVKQTAILWIAIMLMSCNLSSFLAKTPRESQTEQPATKEPQPSDNIKPTQSPTLVPITTAEPLPMPEDGNGQQIEVLDFVYRQDFSNLPADWNLTPYKNKDVEVKYAVKNGVFSWDVDTKTENIVMKKPDPSIFLPDNGFLVEVNTKIQSTKSPVASGIMFRLQDFENFYFAKLSSQGEVSAYAFQNSRWTKLAGPTKSDHFTPKQFNRLTVVEENGTYEFRVNDYPVLNFSDDRFLAGETGLIVELNAGMKSTFYFDDFSVMKPGASAARAEEEENSAPETGEAYWTYEGELGGVKYTLDAPTTFIHSSSGDLDKLCMKNNDHLCVSIRRPVGVWKDPEKMANEVMSDFSQQVDNFSIYHQQHTTIEDGLIAYWVGCTYTQEGIDYESSRLFEIIQNAGFEISGYGEPDMMNTYGQVIKKMMESFRVIAH